MKTAKSLSWLVALAGLWEVVSPYILGYSVTTLAMWNAYIAGVVLIVLAVWAALSEQTRLDRNLEWINAVVGVWLILSPFALNYSTVVAAMWNSIIVGVVVIVLAAWAATTFGRPAPQA
jgi:hydrogenase/urease accessory protein HupE